MLDKETLEQLRRIRPSQEQLKKMFIKEKPMKEQAEKMERALKNPKAKLEDQRRIYKILENPAYQRETMRVDEKESKKVEKEMEGRIKAAINRGDIKKYDPNKDPQGKSWLGQTRK